MNFVKFSKNTFSTEHLQTTAPTVVVVSHLVYHDSLLQNATAILLQNVAVFLQNVTFITKRVGTL